MIPALSFAATLAFVAVGFAVGLRLLALYRRTHGLGELTLGLGLFLIVGVGYPVMIVGLAAATSSLGAGARVLISVAVALMSAGWACVSVFTWRVFRPASKGAILATLLVIAALAFVLAARVAATWQARTLHDLQGFGLATVGTSLVAMACYVWTSVESFRYGSMVRKRVALGLGDVVVANRFLLWGWVGVFSFLSLVPSTWAQLQGVSGQDPVTRLFTAMLGLACSVTLYLAFLPPQSYVAWLRGPSPGTA